MFKDTDNSATSSKEPKSINSEFCAIFPISICLERPKPIIILKQTSKMPFLTKQDWKQLTKDNVKLLTKYSLSIDDNPKARVTLRDRIQLRKLRRLSNLRVAGTHSNRYDHIGYLPIVKAAFCFKYLAGLTLLILNFSLTRIRDDELQKLGFILKSLTRVSRLYLSFAGCHSITDEGVLKVVSSLRYFVCLEHLVIKLFNCSVITDDSLKYISRSLVSCKNLTSLTLDFSYCERMSDKGIEGLTHAFRSLKFLSGLLLDFERCKQITDEGIQTLAGSLKFLVSLSALELNMRGCPKITSKSIDILINGIKHLYYLVTLKINYPDDTQSSDERNRKIGSELKDLSFLWIAVLNEKVVVQR